MSQYALPLSVSPAEKPPSQMDWQADPFTPSALRVQLEEGLGLCQAADASGCLDTYASVGRFDHGFDSLLGGALAVEAGRGFHEFGAGLEAISN